MSLNTIGFYTLDDFRAKNSSVSSPLWRCELILTKKCNFKCSYCRSIGEELHIDQARNIVNLWADQGLKNIRFSGGEPTLYPNLLELVALAKHRNVERIALSTNGAASIPRYLKLLKAGVNDFSISLDADNSTDGDLMAGGRPGAFNRVIDTIRTLSKLTYVTVGVVLTSDNKDRALAIVKFADTLGVSDIRIIPAAQHGTQLPKMDIDDTILAKYPILRYRVNNLNAGIDVRGIPTNGTSKCGLVLDDMAVMGNYHYPCIIYLRENGSPIGEVGPNMRHQRHEWYKNHNSHTDEICKKNCLDVCQNYNTAHEEAHTL
jgi:MoaA/NifB/PqqE/SkfB family radical SAM enzyme